jgi:hypothetical protein
MTVMRLPTVETYNNTETYITRKILSLDKGDRDYVLFNDKDKIKFIKTIERIIRGSMEYRDYIKYLKEVIDMTQCSFFTNVNSVSSRHKISIEIHHEPFTLYDLCDIVLTKHINLSIPLNPLVISEEVMKLHYQNKIGLIPLSSTVHELVHSGKLFIPLQCVAGEYIRFIEEYYDDIPNELHCIIRKKVELSKEASDTSILEKKFVYIEVEGFNLLQPISA